MKNRDEKNIGRMVDCGRYFGKVIASDYSCRDYYGNYPIVVELEHGEIIKTRSFFVDWCFDENKNPVYAPW